MPTQVCDWSKKQQHGMTSLLWSQILLYGYLRWKERKEQRKKEIQKERERKRESDKEREEEKEREREKKRNEERAR